MLKPGLFLLGRLGAAGGSAKGQSSKQWEGWAWGNKYSLSAGYPMVSALPLASVCHLIPG